MKTLKTLFQTLAGVGAMAAHFESSSRGCYGTSVVAARIAARKAVR